MKISIITPVYNSIKTLPGLYGSIVRQKEFVYEWIICDDGGEDGTWEYVEKISQKHRWIEGIRQTHRGMRIARSTNNAIRLVRGDIVLIVMGDSELEDGALKALHDNYVKGSAGSACRLNFKNDRFESYDYRNPKGGKELVNVTGRDLWWCFLVGNGAILPVDKLKEIGGWDEKYIGYGCDDWDVFLRLGANGVPLYQYNMVFIKDFGTKKSEDNPANIKIFNTKAIRLLGLDKLQSMRTNPDYIYL